MVTSVSPDTLGDSNTTVDSGESSPDVTGLLGSKIEVGRFTEDVLRKLVICMVLEKCLNSYHVTVVIQRLLPVLQELICIVVRSRYSMFLIMKRCPSSIPSLDPR